MEQRNNTKKVESLHANVLETMNKYTFLEGYLKQPDINTGKIMPTFLKIMPIVSNYWRDFIDYSNDRFTSAYRSRICTCTLIYIL